jgi:hypothetical protein
LRIAGFDIRILPGQVFVFLPCKRDRGSMPDAIVPPFGAQEKPIGGR